MYQAIQKTKKILQIVLLGFLFACSLPAILSEGKKAANMAARTMRIDEETKLREEALEAKYKAQKEHDEAEELKGELRAERRLRQIERRRAVRAEEAESSWFCLGIFC